MSAFFSERQQDQIEIQNRGIFNSTQLFQFVSDEKGNKITLGEGSFGFVMLIRHIHTQELYALKLISLNSLETEEEKKIIERETKIHPELQHPFIIKMFDAFVNKKAIYLILEYATNGTVEQHFLTKFVYNEQLAFKYFYQTCIAIYYLHSKGVMHRDIKVQATPENLLLDEKDNIKLCDFGWCAEISKARRSTFCGTFEYMAPEIISQKEYDYKIDLWQLGILLYELLHGFTPFKPKTLLEEDKRIEYFRAAITQGHIQFAPHVSSLATDLISKLLVYAPEKRITIQGVLAHIWIFQMKARTGYKDTPEILRLQAEGEQMIIQQAKAKQEEELMLTQLKSELKSPIQKQKNNLKVEQSLPTRSKQIASQTQEDEQVATKETKDEISNKNEDIKQQPQGKVKVNLNEDKDKKQNVNKKDSDSSFSDNLIKEWDKNSFEDNIYTREWARIQSKSSTLISVVDFNAPFFKQNQASLYDEVSLQPSFLKRVIPQQRSTKMRDYLKSGSVKMSTFEITTSTKRTIFGEFDKEKRQRNIIELDKLLQQVSFDNTQKLTSETKIIGQNAIVSQYNDSISQTSSINSNMKTQRK